MTRPRTSRRSRTCTHLTDKSLHSKQVDWELLWFYRTHHTVAFKFSAGWPFHSWSICHNSQRIILCEYTILSLTLIFLGFLLHVSHSVMQPPCRLNVMKIGLVHLLMNLAHCVPNLLDYLVPLYHATTVNIAFMPRLFKNKYFQASIWAHHTTLGSLPRGNAILENMLLSSQQAPVLKSPSCTKCTRKCTQSVPCLHTT